MRGWNQRNVIQWARKLGQEWTIRVLDRVPNSPNNVYNYLSESDFPAAFNEERMKGAYVGAHSADLVRLPLIYHYGGVWMDVSILLFRHLDDICWNALCDENSGYEMAGFTLPNNHKEHQMPYGYMENWFIASAKRHNAFITRWHAVFKHYWEDKEESEGVKYHPLFVHLNTEGYRQDMLDYLAQHASFQRVRTTVDIADGWHGPQWHREKVYLLDARNEGYYFSGETKWKGKMSFEVMSTKRPTESSSKPMTQEEQEAARMCATMVANSCLMKNVHGFKGDTQLSCYWNKPEYKDCDHAEGTYAAFLREASLHYVQTRAPLVPFKIEEDAREYHSYASILQPESELAHSPRRDSGVHISRYGGSTSSSSIATSAGEHSRMHTRNTSAISLATTISEFGEVDDEKRD